MNSLHVTLVITCSSGGDPLSLSLLLKCTTSLCSFPLFGLHQHSTTIKDSQWVPFFPHEGIQLHVFTSYALPCQLPFCQTAPLLPPVAQQQTVTEYSWDGSTSTVVLPTPASDVMGWHHKIGGSTFGASLTLWMHWINKNLKNVPELGMIVSGLIKYTFK